MGRDVTPLSAILGVAMLILAGILLAPTASAAPSDARVLDYYGPCNNVVGCLRSRPPTWMPDRIPRMGVGAVFTGLRWSGWGQDRATATGRVRTCVQGDCIKSSVTLRVYRLRYKTRPRIGRIYQCMRITKGASEIAGAAIDIGATGDPARCR